MEITVPIITNKNLSIWICFELGLINLKIRKQILRENTENLQFLYDKASINASNKINNNILDIESFYSNQISFTSKFISSNQVQIEEQNTKLANFKEAEIQPLLFILHSMVNSFYSIIDSADGSFIIIRCFQNFIICEPLKGMIRTLNVEMTCNYIQEIYNSTLYILQFS